MPQKVNLSLAIPRRNTNFYSKNYHSISKLYSTEYDIVKDYWITAPKRKTISVDVIMHKVNRKTKFFKRPPWMRKQFSLQEFRPRESPFIPTFLKAVVSNIEADCSDCHNKHLVSKDSWYESYNTTPLELEQARQYLRVPIERRLTAEEMDQYLQTISVRIQIAMLKEFLDLLSRKLLHIDRATFAEIASKPLYDILFRVNPKLKFIMIKIIAQLSRTTAETLSFMMIHILHLWEYSMTPQITKAVLCDKYGPLLIGFDEKIQIGIESSGKTPESTLLMAIMDAVDSRSWNTWGGGKVLDNFALLTPFERKRVCSKVTVTDALSDLEIDDYFNSTN